MEARDAAYVLWCAGCLPTKNHPTPNVSGAGLSHLFYQQGTSGALQGRGPSGSLSQDWRPGPWLLGSGFLKERGRAPGPFGT